MTTRSATMVAAALAALAAVPAAAQEPAAACAAYGATLAPRCISVAQAAGAVQPQLGILYAGGNPTLGTASTGGIRLGIIPRVSLSGRLNLGFVDVPAITSEDRDSPGTYATEKVRIFSPALGVNASIGLLPGAGIAPTLGGVGSVDLLVSAAWMPTDLIGGDAFKSGGAPVAVGAGVRVGLLRESFLTPGLSVSLMHRRQGGMQLGNVCEEEELEGDAPGETVCLGAGGGTGTGGDQGEVQFNVKGWSARGAISKRLLGFGITAGLGWDRFESDVDFAFRGEVAGAAGSSRVYRVLDRTVESSRTSAFLDFSYTLLIGSVVGEVGWMQGGERLEGYPTDADFDPEKGTVFGSIGARLSL